ncbi:MAG TPA: anti-sigma factor, partial [Gemmatimonadales bacterium]|nr:anti-sigma factor [Gemmatimonadales bacterium]
RVSALEDTLGLVRGRHTRLVQIPVTTGGRRGYVTIIADTVTHRWLVRCENLAPNDPDQAYQLWFVTETGVLAAKLMPMDTDEPMIMVLDLPSPGVVRVRGAAMSIEPRAGSTEPTGPVVFRQLL